MSEVQSQTEHPDIKDVLVFMRVNPEKVGKKIAYEHWYDFMAVAREFSGEPWRAKVRLLMRSAVGVDFRYIDAYASSAATWGTIKIDSSNDRIYYVGIPNGKSGRPTEKPDEPRIANALKNAYEAGKKDGQKERKV